jgi:hypothetical protein
VDAEDHGWGYNMFLAGQEVAYVDCNYELSFNMTWDIAEQRFPGTDVVMGLPSNTWQEIQAEIEQSQEYQERILQAYSYAHPEQFTAFDFDAAIIERLRSILTLDWYHDEERRHQQVHEFKKAINIRDMSWTSYRYAR